MKELMYAVAIVAIIAMVGYLIYKLRGPKSNAHNNADNEFLKSIRFAISSVGDITNDGCLEVDGIVLNATMSVGDAFTIIDKNDNIIDDGVIVEAIDTGVVKNKFVNYVRPDEVVTLHLRTRCNTINVEAFLK